ncbi:MAG: ATP synthase F1 subunit delta, partial [Pelagibacteraceae bacterium]
MTQSTQSFADAAGRYALSLFELSKDEKIVEEIDANVTLIQKAIQSSEDFKNFINNPTLKKDERINVINILGKNYSLNNYLINFLKILVEKNRIFFLEKILKDFKLILSDFRGEINAIVSMPTKISDAQVKDIEATLNSLLKKKINLDFKLDPSLISGAKLQIGSYMIDD